MDIYSTAFTLPRTSAGSHTAGREPIGTPAPAPAHFHTEHSSASASASAAAAQAQQDDTAAATTATAAAAQPAAPERSNTSPAPVQSFSNLVAQHQRHLASSLGRFGSMRSRFPPSIKGFTSAFSSGGFKRAATERIVEAASKTEAEAEAEAEAERDKEKDRQHSDVEDQLRSTTPGPASAKKGFTASFKKTVSSSANTAQQPAHERTAGAGAVPSSGSAQNAASDIDQGAETETEDLHSNAGTTISLASSSSKFGGGGGGGSTTASSITAPSSVTSGRPGQGPGPPGLYGSSSLDPSTPVSAGWPSSALSKQLPLPPLSFLSDGSTIPRGAATSPVSNEVVQEAANLEQAIKAAQAAGLDPTSAGTLLRAAQSGGNNADIVGTLENATTVHPKARTASAGGSIFNGLGPPSSTGTYALSVPVAFSSSSSSSASQGGAGAGGHQHGSRGGSADRGTVRHREDPTEAVARLANEVMAKHGCMVSYTPVYDSPSDAGNAGGAGGNALSRAGGGAGGSQTAGGAGASTTSASAGAAGSGLSSMYGRQGSFSAALPPPPGSSALSNPYGANAFSSSSTHSLPFSNAFASPTPASGAAGGGGPSGTAVPTLDTLLQFSQGRHPSLGSIHLPQVATPGSMNSVQHPWPTTATTTTPGTHPYASEMNSSTSSFVERPAGAGFQTPSVVSTPFGELGPNNAALYSQLYGGGGGNGVGGTSAAANIAAALSAHNLALGMQSTTSLASSLHHYPHSMHEVPVGGSGSANTPGAGPGGSASYFNQSAQGQGQGQGQQWAGPGAGAGAGGNGSNAFLQQQQPKTRATLPPNALPNQAYAPTAPAQPQPQPQQPIPSRFNFHISGTFQQVLAARGALMREAPFKNRAVIRVPRVDLVEASSSSSAGGGSAGSGPGSRAGSPPGGGGGVAAGGQRKGSNGSAAGSRSGSGSGSGLGLASSSSLVGGDVLKPYVRQRLEAIAGATLANVRIGKTDSHGADLGYGLESERVVELVVEGSFESVEQGRVAVLVLLDELAGLHVEEVEIDYKVHNIVGGRKRCHIQAIEEQTASNIYLPTPFAGVLDATGINNPSVKAKQNTVYITGDKYGVRRAKEILYQAAMSKSTSIISRTTPVLPRKVDWMLLERLEELRSVMSDNATFVNLPPIGSQTNMLSVYGDSRVNIERTTRSIMTLTAQFYVASVWLQAPAYEVFMPDALSPEQLNPVLSHVSNSSGAEVVFKKNNFEMHGLENEVRKAVSQILELDLVKNFNFEVRFQIELANEQREFISGKKNGKTNKIMKQCGVRIKFEPFNDYNFFIDLSGNDKVSALQGLSLLQEELPAEISFHVPESYHKRIIGVGGKNIQRIMKKYGVYVKFSNAEEFAQLGGYLENEDNVIARTPAKNAINLDNLKQSVMELVNEKDREYVTQTAVVARRYHRMLLGEKAGFIRDIEQKTGSTIRFPAPERASDLITLFGPESQIHTAAERLLDLVPFEAEFRTPGASLELVRLLGSQEFGALVERVKRDLCIHIVPFVPPAVTSQQQQQQQQQQAGGNGLEAVFKLRLNRSNADFLPSAKDLIEDFLISRNMQVFPSPARARSDSFASSLPYFANKLLSPAATMSPAAASLGILGPTESNDSLNLELARYNERRQLRAAASTPDIKALFGPGPHHASVVSLGSFGHGGMGGGGGGGGDVGRNGGAMGYGQTSSASASMHAGAGPGAGSSFFNNGGGGGGGSGAASIHGHPHHNRTQLYSGDSHVGLGHLHGHHVSHAHGSSSPLTSSHLYSSPYGHGHAGFNQSDIWGAPRHLPTKSSASLQYPHHISRFSDDTQSIHRIPGEAYYTIGNGPSTSSANANNSASAATSQINLGGSTEDGTYRSLRHHSSFVNRAQSQSLDFGGAAAAAGGGPYSMGGTHPITRNGSTSSGPGVSRGHGHGGLPPGSSSSSLYHMHYGGGGGGSSGHAMHGNNNSIGGAGSSDAHYNPMASPSITGHSTMDLASPGPRAERLPSTGPVSGLHHSVHGSSQSLSRIAQAQAAHANAQAQAQAHLQAQAQVYAHAQAQAHAQAAQAHAAALGGQVWGAESPSMDEVTRLLASIQQ